MSPPAKKNPKAGEDLHTYDGAGDVVRDYTYDVYGQVTGGSGATPNEFAFAGQQSDDSTGLQYLRARYYDPATGVFFRMNAAPTAAQIASYGKALMQEVFRAAVNF